MDYLVIVGDSTDWPNLVLKNGTVVPHEVPEN
jgi:hypothetical protein